jgi:hypothetical protein
MDLELHPARIDRKNKVTYETAMNSLPDGCFVKIEEGAYLIWGDALLPWTPEGYGRRQIRPKDLIATLLTPKPIVGCMRQGYKAELHESW